jgi:hypothetical protein
VNGEWRSGPDVTGPPCGETNPRQLGAQAHTESSLKPTDGARMAGSASNGVGRAVGVTGPHGSNPVQPRSVVLFPFTFPFPFLILFFYKSQILNSIHILF